MKEDINICYRGCHIRYYSSMFSLDYNSSAIVFAKATDEFSWRFKVTVSLLLPRNAIHEKKRERSSDENDDCDSVLDSVDAKNTAPFYRRRHTRGSNSLASVRDCIYKRASCTQAACARPRVKLLFLHLSAFISRPCSTSASMVGATVRYYPQDIVIYIHISAGHVSPYTYNERIII